MYYQIEITFRERQEPASLILPQSELHRLKSCMIDRTESLGFVELITAYQQHVWLNLARVRKLLVLNEGTTPAFEPAKIKPSLQYAESDHADDTGIAWEASLWVTGDDPLHLYELAGDEWIEIATSIDCDEQFFGVSDDDADTLIFSVSDTEMAIGTEVHRYSEDQLKMLCQ
ncbi:MAG: hypothetical protein JXQ75_22115 [Phycisphaerae bacterium]|nr:hypothetical protein [Phycisphaerae bacterium]